MNTSAPRPLTRSNKPIFWSLFGAGGMISALTGPALVLATLILVPLGLLLPTGTLSYARVAGLRAMLAGAARTARAGCVYLFHAFHRFYHTLHDFGVHVGPGMKAACHGAAALLTVVCAVLLARL